MGWFVKWAPFSIIPLPNGGNATMSPVYVADVAAVLENLVRDDSANGKIIELVGPNAYTYASLVELFQDATMRQHHGVPIPKVLLK